MKPEENEENNKKKSDALKSEIMNKIDDYYRLTYNKKFSPGTSFIQNSGKLFDSAELKLGVESILDGWWTEGRFSSMFSNELGKFLPRKHVILVNSGSSANLLAFSSLTSHLIPKEKRLTAGDEVITVAAGFPTTVNPVIQNGCVPVFVDVSIETLTPKMDLVKEAVTDKTKAIFLAHPLGNPFDLESVKKICDENGLWLIEDSCDALGSMYKERNVGTFGDVSTISFYPAHHITMGEGGAVLTDNSVIDKASTAIRDWGRDCWCLTGKDNTCEKRFEWGLGDLPFGYDHKFIYSHIGYNLKLTDMQASIGLAQIRKINDFLEARERNFQLLMDFFTEYSDYFYLPKSEKHAKPSWFGFPLTIKENSGFSRNDIITFLNRKKIGTRLVFAGNITKQPYFKNYKINYRIYQDLKNTDFIMNNTFWIGVQPSITSEMIDYEKEVLKDFFRTSIR